MCAPHPHFRRRTNDCVTTVGTNTDSGTLQVATAHEERGAADSRPLPPRDLLIYMRTRLLSPLMGRLLYRCPWGYNHRELNLYDFANANPVKFVEPFSEPIEIGAAGLSIGAAALIAAAAAMGITVTACLTSPPCQRLAARNAAAAIDSAAQAAADAAKAAAEAAANAAKATGSGIAKCWHWVVGATVVASVLGDCLKATGSGSAWVKYCMTFADPVDRAKCMDESKGNNRTPPQKRKNWRHMQFGD